MEQDSSNGRIWGFVGLVNGVSADSAIKIDDYLSLEDDYGPGSSILGPIPLDPVGSNIGLNKQPNPINTQQRQDLAEFLRTALSVNTTNTGYLSW
jgi:hypothetical protein